MDRFEELKSFVDRASKLVVDDVLEQQEFEFAKRKVYNDFKNKTPERKAQQRKYEKTEKGKKQNRMRAAWSGFIRRKSSRRYSKEEFQKIRLFYLNTPKGHHVDHVIPLCCGGEHVMENLQYLTVDANSRKKRAITT